MTTAFLLPEFLTINYWLTELSVTHNTFIFYSNIKDTSTAEFNIIQCGTGSAVTLA